MTRVLTVAMGLACLLAPLSHGQKSIEEVYLDTRGDYTAKRRAMNKAIRKAKPTSAAEHAALVKKHGPDLDQLLVPLWKAIDAAPKSADAPDALVWIFLRDKDGAHGEKAAELIVAHHADVANVYRIILPLVDRGGTLAWKVAAALSKSKVQRVQATAIFAQAKLLLRRNLGDDEKKASAALDLLLAEHPHVLGIQRRVAQLKKNMALLIGRVAPDIEGDDIDGVAFKLSDYRGKAILLDFWGHW